MNFKLKTPATGIEARVQGFEMSFFIYWHFDGDFLWNQTSPNQWVGITQNCKLTVSLNEHQDAKFTKAPESLYYGETQDHWLLTVHTISGTLDTHFQFD